MLYFDSILKRDSEWFDQNNPAEMSTRILKETTTIERGIGLKFGLIFMGFSTFCFGYGFAFYRGWEFTLVLLAAFPVMVLPGAIMGIVFVSGMKEQLKAYAQSAGYADQALNAIKVVHTYG